MRIKDLPKVELPREKIENYGPHKLQDHELVAILLGSGIVGLNVLQLSKKILKVIKDIGVQKIQFKDLLRIKGLGRARAAQILAMIELSGRLKPTEAQAALSAQDIWSMCLDFRESKKEHVAVFYLDAQSKVIERQIIAIGRVNASEVHPREVFEPAVRLSAVSVVVVHNHPSGVLNSSPDDRGLTSRLVDAGKILGIPLVDHIVVTGVGFLSIR